MLAFFMRNQEVSIMAIIANNIKNNNILYKNIENELFLEILTLSKIVLKQK